MKQFIVLVGLVLTSGLTACGGAIDGDSYGRPWVPPVPVAPAAPPRPMAPPAEMFNSQNVDRVVEKHGVVNFNDCKRMEARFKQQGRRIRLTDTKPNPNRGATLFWICHFEGEDAEEGYFEDTRYNSSHEYDY